MAPFPFFKHSAVQTHVPTWINIYIYICIFSGQMEMQVFKSRIRGWKAPVLLLWVCGQTPVTFSCVSESTFLLKYRKRVPRNGWHCVGLGTEGIALLQMLQLLTENLGASVLWLSISFLGVLISKIMLITLSKKGWLHNNLVNFQRQQLNANY